LEFEHGSLLEYCEGRFHCSRDCRRGGIVQEVTAIQRTITIAAAHNHLGIYYELVSAPRLGRDLEFRQETLILMLWAYRFSCRLFFCNQLGMGFLGVDGLGIVLAFLAMGALATVWPQQTN